MILTMKYVVNPGSNKWGKHYFCIYFDLVTKLFFELIFRALPLKTPYKFSNAINIFNTQQCSQYRTKT